MADNIHDICGKYPPGSNDMKAAQVSNNIFTANR